MSLDYQSLLEGIPVSIRAELLTTFNEVLRNYREHRWEPSTLNAGKFCEVVYSILKGHVDKTFPTRATKPPNMVDACRALERADSSNPRSIRVQIPRVLIALYEVRNNRGVGHIGSDVDPNGMDSAAVLAMTQWTMAELVRLFHGVSPDEAARAVESLVQRRHPLIWEVGDVRRVLSPGLGRKDQVLLLLYQRNASVREQDLARCLDVKNVAVFRRDVLRSLHRKRLIEYDETSRLATLSPLGQGVSENLLAALE